jgi:hypothetical protein
MPSSPILFASKNNKIVIHKFNVFRLFQSPILKCYAPLSSKLFLSIYIIKNYINLISSNLDS